MKRLLSSILALALGLGSVPAQAQTALGRASLPAPAAPVPVPAGLVAPAAGLLAPALGASLTPAAFASLGPSPVPSAAAPLPARPVSAVPTLPALAPARTATPLETLRSAASPEIAPGTGAIFDGSVTRSAAASVEPPVQPEAAAQPRRTLLQRYKAGRNKNPLQNAFGKAMFLTTTAAVAVPVLWGAAPALKLAYAAVAADALMLAVVLPVALVLAVWRKLKRAPQTAAKPPPSRRAKLAVVALGVVLGLGAAVVPYQATGPVVERVKAYTERHDPAAKQTRARWISGGAVEDEVFKVLAPNPVGREVLDKLRDRGGVLRLPPFFISRQDDSYGQHENLFDGVYLNEGEVTGRGWTVEQFLKDPALQRQLIREMSSTVLHELTHAVQGRRPPWTPGYFKLTFEAEQEAFFQEMLFRLAELERDPAARNNGHDQWMVPDAAADLDGFLKSVAAMYEKNVSVPNPYFDAFLAEQRARWPAFRVHIYQVLAARAHTPASAKMYMDKAKAAAKEAGLPEPAPLAASR
ncbi:MAG: hypothetical protein HYV14_18390 [Elusimicrobia bacterium]|nr:hypothetical protein [Elusimicrobiota bacterium]